MRGRLPIGHDLYEAQSFFVARRAQATFNMLFHYFSIGVYPKFYEDLAHDDVVGLFPFEIFAEEFGHAAGATGKFSGGVGSHVDDLGHRVDPDSGFLFNSVGGLSIGSSGQDQEEECTECFHAWARFGLG